MMCCRHEARVDLFRQTAGDVINCLVDISVDIELIELVETYLLAQGEKTMTQCIAYTNSRYELLAQVQDRLGWDSFVEGRISTLFLETVKPFLEKSRRRSLVKWGCSLVEALINITHKQWLLRNSRKHYRGADGLTGEQHERIFARIRELMWTEEDELLPAHRYLLHEDFAVLGECSAKIRQIWIAQMESALRAAARVRDGLIVPGSLRTFLRPRLRPRLTHRCAPASQSCPPTTRHSPPPPHASRWQQHLYILRSRRWSAAGTRSSFCPGQRAGVL